MAGESPSADGGCVSSVLCKSLLGVATAFAVAGKSCLAVLYILIGRSQLWAMINGGDIYVAGHCDVAG